MTSQEYPKKAASTRIHITRYARHTTIKLMNLHAATETTIIDQPTLTRKSRQLPRRGQINRQQGTYADESQIN